MMRRSGSKFALLAVIAGAYCGSEALARVDVIIAPGQPAPGMPDGAVFSLAGIGTVNADGVAAVPASASGPGLDSTNNRGIWIGSVDGLDLAARTGSAAPGTPDGVVFDRFEGLSRINIADETAFLGVLTGTGVNSSNNRGIWAGPAGAVELVARNGSPAPGTANSFTSVPGNFVFNDLGQAAFRGEVSAGFPQNVGIWHGIAGSLELLARGNMSAPGTNTFFGSIDAPVLNASGQAAFGATLLADAVTAESYGIWIGSPGNLQLAFRGGQQVPGAPAGVTFGPIDTPMLNNAGEMSFFGQASDGREGLWAGTPAHVDFVAGIGEQAPGTPAGVTFGLLFNPLIGGGGHASFAAGLMGPGIDMSNNLALYTGQPDDVQLVARRGSQAPHTPAGVHFTNFATAVMLNSSGVTAFAADIAGPGVDSSNSRGIWMVDPTGEAVLVARAGDPVDGKILFSFIMGQFASGGEDGRASTLNGHGQLLFFASFNEFTHMSQGSVLYTPDLRWRRDTGGEWDNTDNWTLSLPPAHVHDVTIDPTVNLTVAGPTSDRAVRNLTVGGGAGAAVLNLQSDVKFSVGQDLAIASGAAVYSAGALEADRVDVAAGAKLDIGGGEVLLRGQSFEEVAALVARGRSNGTWTDDGITSTAAAADPAREIGYGPVPEGVLVKYTFGGDATLDGAVTIADLGVLAANWQQSDRAWYQGDFNYDGEVTIADLGILAANWQAGAGGSSMSFEEAMAMFDVFNGVVVPEPAAAGMLLFGLGALGRRRRRTRSTA
jgi:hypothetical protein